MRRSETPWAAAAIATRLQAEARAAGYRRLIMISGEASWGRHVAEAMLTAAYGSLHDVLWAALAPPPSARPCAPDGLVRVLGSEAAALVLDTHDGLDPDGLGAGMGTVRAGGLVLMLTPPLADWPGFADPQAQRLAVDGWGIEAVGHRFIQRLLRVLTADPLTVVIEQSGPTPQPQPLPVGVQGPAPNDRDCVTRDQAQAVHAVLRAATGQRRRPTVLTADRGRGKSAALGIAAARYLLSRGGTVVVTGPRRAAAEAVLHHAALCLGQSIRRARVDAGGGASIRFLLPEEIARCEQTPALVLVDEAAALPAAMLGDLLRRYSRIVFATTIHGYEGTGRGFVLRFQPTLETETPRWRHVALKEPIRWREGDPVEALVFRALLLDAELPTVDASLVAPQQTRMETVDRNALTRDEPLLRDVFGLLIHAHYRTRPLDLRNVLDGPNLSLLLLRHGDAVVAAALIAEEGGFPEHVAQAIWSGARRPRGHLLPQSLACHVGVLDGATCRAARMMRIAVHPALQGRGLGTHLMQRVTSVARERGYDLIGASFGATVGLLRFWEKTGSRPLRLGMRRDAASGTHSALTACPLNARGAVFFDQARALIARDFPAQLSDPLQAVEPAIVLALVRHLSLPEPEDRDWLDAVGFAHGYRSYEVSLAALRRITLAALASGRSARWLSAEQQQAMVARILQQRSWADAAASAGQTGRPALIEMLREAMRRLIAKQAPPHARRLARAIG